MMPLDEYHAKRDFAATPEPEGATGSAHPGAARFVIHKHAARQLHYDLRLEIGGVYASWAVPKGPSLDTHDRHLAVHVEDHPLEYGEFEGTIPAGQYGAGTVMIWDRGDFLPLEDPAAGVAKGSLKFALNGAKLHGRWALVRMKPRPGEKRENWLLIKERDEEVRPSSEYDVLAELPDSAATGRSMEQIAASGEEWTSGGVEGDPGAVAAASADEVVASDPFPADAPLQLATLVTAAPEGDEWLHEVKYDGYRLRLEKQGARVRARTRSGQDWSERFPGIVAAIAALPVETALLDGEAVAMDADGRSDFGALQQALSHDDAGAVRYEAFDLLYLEGHDLRAETLVRRKEVLTALLAHALASGPLHYVEHVAGHGPDYHEAACGLLLEGSVSKRADRPWVGGRTRDWLKVKCIARQEFVVCGWTDPQGHRTGFGALLLGVYEPDGSLRYAGRVGTGFSDATLADLHGRLERLARTTAPFANAPEAGVHWVTPSLVAEVAFREWTRDGLVRQASFRGFRDDKDPRTVVRESPAAPPSPDPDPPARVVTGSGNRVAGVTITNPQRVLEPAGITKLELARYYESVAGWILPHIEGRLLTIVRCPKASDGVPACFYQKHPESRGWPASLEPVAVTDKGGPATYFVVHGIEGLVSLAQLGTLEIHTWGSRAADPERPDRVIFDLDPGEGLTFADVADAARIVRDALAALGMASFVKTTGGHGLHVVAPIVPAGSFTEVRAFTRGVVDALVAAHPDRFVGRMAKAERAGRVFVDYLRNAHGATAVAAYSTRARAGGPVSVPVRWDELAGLDPLSFDTHSVPHRLSALGSDPWADYAASATHIPTRS